MRVLLLLLLMVIGACTPKPKPESEITYRFNHQTSELTIKVKLKEGMHAYAPGEPVGKPIELIIEPKNKWELDGPATLPSGNPKHLLNQAFEIKAKLKNGSGPIFGIFKMQLCSDSSCGRPQDYPFKI